MIRPAHRPICIITCILILSSFLACSNMMDEKKEDENVYDTTSPEIVSVSPIENSRNIKNNSVITATFNEVIDPTTVTNENFIILQGITGVSGTVTYDINTNTAIFTPDSSLSNDKEYTATITTGMTDNAGNPIESEKTWSFIVEIIPEMWTWISGSNTTNQRGVYGTQGVPDPSNVPGARSQSVSWIDSEGNLWLFGGNGYDSAGNRGSLNDLWKFDGSNWTWVSGSNTFHQTGVYGTKGAADADNMPGSRIAAVAWIDKDDTVFLFGGNGFDSAGSAGSLNDLWMYDGTNWTWVSGSNIIDQNGVYGTKGVGNAVNIPGARCLSARWIDNDGNLYLFGGTGLDSEGTTGQLNDLWEFDRTNWIWISGANIANQSGIYGIKGTADSDNTPGARFSSTGSIDNEGNLWLFGGHCYATSGNFNDLWKFDGENWTWISGSNIVNQTGVYGTKTQTDPANVPGTRVRSLSWIDPDGNFWIFGGYGYATTNSTGILNDLWKFDGENWTWISGSNTIDQTGTYGTQGIPDASNIPGGRFQSVNWIDNDGNFWLFGGYDERYFNDLWRYRPLYE